jgi:hypothetical protein
MPTDPAVPTYTLNGHTFTIESYVHLHLLGATSAELACLYGYRTTREYEAAVAESAVLTAAAADGRLGIDSRVAASLARCATGYDTVAARTTWIDGELQVAHVPQRVEPNVAACIAWLRSRRPAEWGDKSTHPNISITVEASEHRAAIHQYLSGAPEGAIAHSPRSAIGLTHSGTD